MTRIFYKDIVILLLAVSFLYFFMLGSRSLNNPDEGRYAEISREMAVSHDYITPKINGLMFLDKPAMFFWLESTMIKMFGFNDWVYRSIPAIFGILGCLITFITTYFLYDRRTAWIASFILATTPIYFVMSRFINLDLTVAIFIETSLFLFLLATNTRHEKWKRNLFWLAYGFAAFATLTKGLIGIVFPLIVIGVWIILCNQWAILKRMYLASGLTLYSSIVLPWYLLVQKVNPDFFNYFFIYQHIKRFAQTGFNNVQPWWFYLLVILLGFLPWIFNFSKVISSDLKVYWKNRSTYKNELFLLLNIVLILLFFSIPQSKIISYILPIFPPMAILTARHISRNCQNKQLSPLSTLRAYIAILIACLLLCSFVVAQLPIKSNKEITLTVKQMAKPTDKVILFWTYLDDVPVYLNRKVMLVNNWDPITSETDGWKVHFIYAMQHQNDNQQLLWEDDFIKEWDSPQKCYVFLKKYDLQKLTLLIKGPFYLVTQNKRVLVVTNHNHRPQI